MTAADSLELDRIQMQALKSIFGWRNSYSSLLAKSGLETLHDRREACFVELAKKLGNNPRYAPWFKTRLVSRAGLRNLEKYEVKRAGTERYRQSPLNRMRRKLNEIINI